MKTYYVRTYDASKIVESKSFTNECDASAFFYESIEKILKENSILKSSICSQYMTFSRKAFFNKKDNYNIITGTNIDDIILKIEESDE